MKEIVGKVDEMTKDEAVKILKQTHPMYSYVKGEYSIYDIDEAYRMAIEALEQEPVIDKIRAEIDNALSDGMIHKKTVLGIIDIYKAESGDKE